MRLRKSKKDTVEQTSILKSALDGVYLCMDWIETEEGPEYWLTVYEKIDDLQHSLLKRHG